MESLQHIELFSQILQACYLWHAASPGPAWTAADVTRLAINLYLTAAGVRGGCPAGGLADRRCPCEALGAHALRQSGAAPMFLSEARHDLLYPNPEPREARGTVTWVCNSGSGEMSLWSEPVGGGTSLAAIVDGRLAAIRAAMKHLGYTVHARIE